MSDNSLCTVSVFMEKKIYLSPVSSDGSDLFGRHFPLGGKRDVFTSELQDYLFMFGLFGGLLHLRRKRHR